MISRVSIAVCRQFLSKTEAVSCHLFLLLSAKNKLCTCLIHKYVWYNSVFVYYQSKNCCLCSERTGVPYPSYVGCLPHNQDEDKQFFGEDFLFHSGWINAKGAQWVHQDWQYLNTFVLYINTFWPSWQRKSIFCSQKSLTYPLNKIILKPVLPQKIQVLLLPSENWNRSVWKIYRCW